jgi:type IV secretory pathway TraG/TraD family ATPase VirD4
MEFLALIIFTIIMYQLFKLIFIKLGLISAIATKQTSNYFNPLTHILAFLIKGSKTDGTMSKYNQDKLFSFKNKGLLLDGKDKRLSLKDSFNHLALVSRTGAGKTTSYVIPNIFKLASEHNSMLITDISGELHHLTSGHLAKKGYKIYVLNPEDLSESIGYNPLYYLKNSMDIDELVTILIKSNKEGKVSGDKEFWENSAKNVIAMIIKLLLLKGNPKWMNLANVRYLANNFGIDGANIKHLFDNCSDEKLKDEFFALTQINPSTLTSIIANVNTALNPIGINDNLEKLTANHTINFDKIRSEKSVIYIKIPGQKQKQYKFLLNIFYSQFFNHMMIKLPTKKDLPIFCLLDEFGNMNLPNFDTTITTIRKYNVSISIILQNTNQLKNVYGENAKTILDGGVSSKLYYNGVDMQTAEELSKILGDRENIRKKDLNGNYIYKDEPIMRASEIRTIEDDEALLVFANKIPARFTIKPYYKDFVFNQYAKIEPFKINISSHMQEVDFIEIY